MHGGLRSAGAGLGVVALLVALAGGVATAASVDRAVGTPADAVDGDETLSAVEALRVRTLREQVRTHLPLDRWGDSHWGVLVTSLDRGDTLYALDAHRAMAPASNVKLLTTAVALHHLGVDYRFRTFLLSDASVEDGVLRGDLVLYGTGDPTLGQQDSRTGRAPLHEMAQRLAERGIRCVSGDVVGDGSYFQGPLRPAGWRTQYLNESFAAPVDALQYGENLATLRVDPGPTVGAPVRVGTQPVDAPLAVRVNARTVSRRTSHPVWALRTDPDAPVEVTGQMRLQDPAIWRRMTVSDPALYAATRLRAALESAGICVHGSARSNRARDASIVPERATWAPTFVEDGSARPRILAEHRSEPLLQLLWVVNRQSHNLYAESIARTVGRVVEGDGSFEAAADVMRRFLVDDLGVPPAEARPVDGSGLSPENRMSPYALVRVIDHLAASDHWPAFWSTLPQAGNWRELRRMYGTPAAENLRAKTGTLRRVSALSGVVEAGNGERLLFSIVSNDVPSTSAAKAVEDRIGATLASFSRPAPPDAEPLPAGSPLDVEAAELASARTQD